MSIDPSIEPVPALGSFESIEKALIGLTVLEKLERIERIARSIRVEPLDPAEQARLIEERTRLQRENLFALIKGLESLPTAPNPDGFSNRDHDKILYGLPS